MYKALKDVNNGVVYQWTDLSTNNSVIIDSTNWKKETEWSTEEIASLFSSIIKVETEIVPELDFKSVEEYDDQEEYYYELKEDDE